MSEHVAQAQIHCPAQKNIKNRSAGQAVLNSVREAGPAPHRLEVMPVNPLIERAGLLMIFEAPVACVGGVNRDPLQGTDPKFEPGIGLQAFPRSLDQANRRERGGEQHQRIWLFVEGEDFFNRGINQYTAFEDRHDFSLAVLAVGSGGDQCFIATALFGRVEALVSAGHQFSGILVSGMEFGDAE